MYSAVTKPDLAGVVYTRPTCCRIVARERNTPMIAPGTTWADAGGASLPMRSPARRLNSGMAASSTMKVTAERMNTKVKGWI